MKTGRVQNRGRVLLPQAIRRAAGFEPGDLLSFRVTAPGTVEIVRLPRLSLDASFDRYRITTPIDGDRDWPDWEAGALERATCADGVC
jgi:bifunctional DNA-binding transcriptional regulator/antitoxin component of YhaV-PrlF toxin-antitoxin module